MSRICVTCDGEWHEDSMEHSWLTWQHGPSLRWHLDTRTRDNSSKLSPQHHTVITCITEHGERPGDPGRGDGHLGESFPIFKSLNAIHIVFYLKTCMKWISLKNKNAQTVIILNQESKCMSLDGCDLMTNYSVQCLISRVAARDKTPRCSGVVIILMAVSRSFQALSPSSLEDSDSRPI